MKVITFSLWGNNPTYNIGAIRNAEDATIMYPGFKCWFYIHTDSVPQSTIDKLHMMDHVKIIYKTGDITNEVCKPRMWRFEAIDEPEVEVMLSRDTDTRILQREVLAVNEWLASNTLFHIMRDHPHHNFCILGGMFGTRKIQGVHWSTIMNQYHQTGDRMYDQDFLRDYIYPLIQHNSVIHASFHNREKHSKHFPMSYNNDYRFVGEYVYHDESRSNYHINELINSIKI